MSAREGLLGQAAQAPSLSSPTTRARALALALPLWTAALRSPLRAPAVLRCCADCWPQAVLRAATHGTRMVAPHTPALAHSSGGDVRQGRAGRQLGRLAQHALKEGMRRYVHGVRRAAARHEGGAESGAHGGAGSARTGAGELTAWAQPFFAGVCALAPTWGK